jgi:hypothetical protein
MSRTSVPIATVDEDSDPSSREDDVGCPSATDRGKVNAKAQSRAMKYSPDSKFGARVPTAVGAHGIPSSGG